MAKTTRPAKRSVSNDAARKAQQKVIQSNVKKTIKGLIGSR